MLPGCRRSKECPVTGRELQVTLVSIGCLLGGVVMVGLADTGPLDDAPGPFSAEFPQALSATIATIAPARIRTPVERGTLSEVTGAAGCPSGARPSEAFYRRSALVDQQCPVRFGLSTMTKRAGQV